MNTPTPTPRTDAEITFTGAYTHTCGELSCDECNARTAALRAERDQLRADCENETKWAAHYLADSLAAKARAEKAEAELAAAKERLRSEAMDDYASIKDLQRELTTLTAERDQLTARAERAEAAETVALAKWNGALERALKAEADLAALEQCHDDNCRAVVKIAAELATERARFDWLESPSGMDWQWEPTRLTVSRAAIDAGMKEGAK